MKSTMVELVQELELISMDNMTAKEKWCFRNIIKDARAGEYHDYKNKKYACGKVAIVEHLRMFKMPVLNEIALRVIDGQFDEEADDDDKAMMRKDIMENTVNKTQAEAMCKVLGL